MTIVTGIGSPASAFLMQDDFTTNAPEGVVIPSDMDDNGAARVAISESMVALILAVVATVFF